MGYQDVVNLAGGFADWKRNGFEVTIPRVLSSEQRSRYSRHLLIPEVGEDGQQRLLDARVLLVGAGGLGSPASMYLAAAGVGTLGIVDADVVDESNLQRQILHSTPDVGRPKVESAVNRLRAINPTIEIVPYDTVLSSANAFEILEPWDVVIDGTDNFPVRYLVNDATQMLGKPLVYGSIYQWDGQATVFMPGGDAPCYRCLFPQPPPPGTVPSCAEGGVFGVLPGIVGSIQATEAIKLITGVGEPLIGKLLVFDAQAMEFTTVKVRWDADCPVCGKDPTITELIDYDAFCGLAPGQVPPEAEHGVSTLA
jgi:adenylyltransferase/sulfurtransferase